MTFACCEEWSFKKIFVKVCAHVLGFCCELRQPAARIRFNLKHQRLNFPLPCKHVAHTLRAFSCQEHVWRRTSARGPAKPWNNQRYKTFVAYPWKNLKLANFSRGTNFADETVPVLESRNGAKTGPSRPDTSKSN